MKATILGALATLLLGSFATSAIACDHAQNRASSILDNGKPIQSALLASPAQLDPLKGKRSSDVIRVCNDDYMACLPGDTCCSTGEACPADGKCP